MALLIAACGGGGGGGGADTGGTLPNLVGLSEPAAVSALTARGLKVGTISRSGSAASATGVVVSQAPSAGAAVAEGSAVAFVVSANSSGANPPLRLYEAQCARAYRPGSPPLVGPQASVRAQIESTYELVSATATASGSETTVGLTPSTDCGPTIAGVIDLSSLPSGPLRVTVRAVDSRGNFAELSYEVLLDRPPQLTIVEPREGTIALPTLPVDVRCSDDLPGCVAGITVSSSLSRSGTGGVAENLDLTAMIGQCGVATITAYDLSYQQVGPSNVSFCVEDPARLTIVERVPAPILDADATRLLFYEQTPSGDSLAIYARATGAVERVPVPSGWQRLVSRAAALTPTGALAVLSATVSSDGTDHVFLLRQGTITDLGVANPHNSLVVRGNYAVWNEHGTVWRVDTQSGATAIVTSAAQPYAAVTTDGTVVYSNADHQLVRVRAGVHTTLTNDPNLLHGMPLADRDAVVFRQSTRDFTEYAIAFIEGTSAPVLLSGRHRVGSQPGDWPASQGWPPHRHSEYRIENGWVVYADLSTANAPQIFTRNPDGAASQRTDLSSRHRVDALAANGELMTLSSGSNNVRNRHFSRPGAMSSPISSDSGSAYYINGAWYVSLHGTLLSVTTSGL